MSFGLGHGRVYDAPRAFLRLLTARTIAETKRIGNATSV
jgi:hypothetical protein